MAPILKWMWQYHFDVVRRAINLVDPDGKHIGRLFTGSDCGPCPCFGAGKNGNQAADS